MGQLSFAKRMGYSHYYHVGVIDVGTCVWVTVGIPGGYQSGNCHFVHPPNIIEEMLGMTYKSKLDKAIARVQKCCDKYNREIERTTEVLGQVA